MKIDLIDSNPADGERPEPERADGQDCIGRVGECGTNYPLSGRGWEPGKPYFPQLPDEVQLSSRPEGKFCPMDGLESSPCMGQNLPISKKEKKKTDSSQNNRRENARRCFGQYQNVFLLDSELAELQSTYPDQYEDYINRLSAYMASSGKHYANHYATIRKWLDEDSKPKPSKNYDYTETYEEGECL